MAASTLVETLKGDFSPVRRPLPVGRAAVLWLLGSWAFVAAIMVVTGPFRPGFSEQLLSSPRFLLECLLGMAVSVAATWAALALSVPGFSSFGRLLVAAATPLVAWFGTYFYGLLDPALAPSMVGKRAHCLLETLFLGLPPFAALLALVRRRAAIRRAWAGALGGVAGAGIPALLMQMACMYDPRHILTHHLGPMLLVSVLGAALAWRFLPRL